MPSYNNRNFAVLRLIIPKMAQYIITTVTPGLPPNLVQVLELAQASQFATAYKDYCRQVIFNQLGSTASQTIDCVNNDVNPGLCYLFPLSNVKGIYSGNDATLNCAAQGWVLSTFQINDFFTSLHYTQNILPSNLSAKMRDELLGYDNDNVGATTDGISYFWKNGVYNFGNPSVGSYRSLIIGFGDGIQITMMCNSAVNLQATAIAAHQDWHP